MNRLLFPAIILLCFWGCRSGNRLQVDLSSVTVDAVHIQRYDLDLFAVRTNHLYKDIGELQPVYTYFLGQDLKDTARLKELRNYLVNPRNQEFYQGVKEHYGDLAWLETQMTEAFRHLRYYIPGFPVPGVVTYISGGDYEAPVQYGERIILIGIDNYLGAEWPVYVADRIPLYRIQRMDKDYILPDCMLLVSKVIFPEKLPGNNLLEYMIEAGKRLWFTEAMLPVTAERLLIGYQVPQYEWIRKNERHVWAAMMENQMLYATDGRTIRIFMSDGPFTAEFSSESPSRMGEWIGWQIVRRYMEKNRDVTLQQLMGETDAQKILSGSGYKPSH